jgi:predicted nuclease of predicted toxin-antitoxin system
MKLLFDQNLSPNLVKRLADLVPDFSHVQYVGLDCAHDDQVWEHVLKENEQRGLPVFGGESEER